jgi:predicted Zn-dependent protease
MSERNQTIALVVLGALALAGMACTGVLLFYGRTADAQLSGIASTAVGAIAGAVTFSRGKDKPE